MCIHENDQRQLNVITLSLVHVIPLRKTGCADPPLLVSFPVAPHPIIAGPHIVKHPHQLELVACSRLGGYE